MANGLIQLSDSLDKAQSGAYPEPHRQQSAARGFAPRGPTKESRRV